MRAQPCGSLFSKQPCKGLFAQTQLCDLRMFNSHPLGLLLGLLPWLALSDPVPKPCQGACGLLFS